MKHDFQRALRRLLQHSRGRSAQSGSAPAHEGRSANGYRALCVFRERFIHRTGAHERKMAAAPAGRHNAPPPSADHAAYGAAKAVAEGDFS